jgi:hypothetical protein
MDAHPAFLHFDKLPDHVLKVGVNFTVVGKPEIKEIAEDIEVIGLPLDRTEKLEQPIVTGIVSMAEMGISDKKNLHLDWDP